MTSEHGFRGRRLLAVVAALGLLATLPAHGGGPATSTSWIMVDHQLVAGGGLQTAPSYSVQACVSFSVSGRQSSASYRVEAGCVTSVGGPVPVELVSFAVE